MNTEYQHLKVNKKNDKPDDCLYFNINDFDKLREFIKQLSNSSKRRQVVKVNVDFSIKNWRNFKGNSIEKRNLLSNLREVALYLDIKVLKVPISLETPELLSCFLINVGITKFVILYDFVTKINISFKAVIYKILTKSQEIFVLLESKSKNFEKETIFFKEICFKFKKPNKIFNFCYKNLKTSLLQMKGNILTINNNLKYNFYQIIMKLLPKKLSKIEVLFSNLDSALQNLKTDYFLFFNHFTKYSFTKLKLKLNDSLEILSFISKCKNNLIELYVKFRNLDLTNKMKNYKIKTYILAGKTIKKFNLSFKWNDYQLFELKTLSLLCAKGVKLGEKINMKRLIGNRLSKKGNDRKLSNYLWKRRHDMQMFEIKKLKN